MTAALRSLAESLATAGDPAVVFGVIRSDLAGASPGTKVGEDRLRTALRAAGVRLSPRQLAIELRGLGVLDDDGRFDDARAAAVEIALELAAGSFGSTSRRDRWRLVATVPQRHWKMVGLPAVRQTAGTVLDIVDGAQHHLRIAVPFVDQAAIAWLLEPLARARARGAAITISTSPGHGDLFRPLVDRCAVEPGPSVRVVEVDADSSPLGSHAKVVLADGERAYLGSANLTSAGVGRQFEIGADVAGPQVVQIDTILAAVDRLGGVRFEVPAGASDT